MVDGVIELDTPRAEAALALKRTSLVAKAYENSRILKDVEDFGDKVRSGEVVEPK